MEVPRFSGDEDEFDIWWVRAKTYAARYGFQATMIGTAEGNLPANAGPGANQGEIDAVERNNKAMYFLTVAMPDSMLLSVVAAGESDPAWPDHAKAHLMITYLKNYFDVEEDIVEEDDVEEDVNVEEDDDVEEDDVEEDDVEEDVNVEEDDDVFIERLSNTVGVKYSDVVRHANEEAGSKEEEDDDAFIERLSNMVDLADRLDNEGSVEGKVRESMESVEDSGIADLLDKEVTKDYDSANDSKSNG
jgi:hypothetical protein